MFSPVDPKQSFVKLEHELLEFWQKNRIFEKSVQAREAKAKFVFFDGPPFANGLPHYGHILANALKDAVTRYWTMRGYFVPRVNGWDCHGLPVEYEVEKELGLAGKKDIEAMGVAEFNAKCRESVFRYTKEWEELLRRIARWVDFGNSYATLDNDYMESIWWVFKQIWLKEMVYEGYKTMQICPRCETPLSNFEVSQGYKDVTDLATTVMFELEQEPGTYFLAWTTTPWSLITTMGLAIGKNIDYVKVQTERGIFILAGNRLEAVFANTGLSYAVIEQFKGGKIIGQKYRHVFDYFFNDPTVKKAKGVYKTYFADYVTDKDGTGIATINGSYGEDDMNSAQKYGLPIIMDIGIDGCYKEVVKDFAGKFVKGQEQNIAYYIEQKERLFKRENYRHSYPHCWRCDTPLLNYATKSWFIRVTDLKPRLIKNNKKIYWQPQHLQFGRFGKWLEGARDWAISRNRFWGCPIPIWRCECGKMECIGSIAELKARSGGKLPLRKGELDLHKPYIDEIIFECEVCGKIMRRIPEVLDCWFESGAMPYAQLHYPFENKQEFEDNFPANFIAEGIDQTRGWFYTLHVLASILFDKPAFKNVIVNGILLAEDGEKLSKRKKNYPDPNLLFETKGVDATRMFMYMSTTPLAEDARFSEKHVEDVIKKFSLILWNAYSFFVTYANIDKWSAAEAKKDFAPSHKLDQWILSQLHQLIKIVTEEMDNYNLTRATRPMLDFVDSLSNWYIRRSRRRFWKSENDADKFEAYQTLYTVLVEFSKLLAPFMPFLADSIYKNLTTSLKVGSSRSETSVHLADWPKADKAYIKAALNQEHFVIRQIVTLGHSVRDKANIKVRQPLALAQVGLPANVDEKMVLAQKEVICEELNVKDLQILKDVSEFVQRVAIPNAKVLGPRYGKNVQTIIRKAKEGEFEVGADNTVRIGDFTLGPDEVEVGFHGRKGYDVASSNGISVVLDTKITDELRQEGQAREIVRMIQDLRKEAGYNVDDRIYILVEAAGEVGAAVLAFADYIKRETLAIELQNKGDMEWDKERVADVDGVRVRVVVCR